MPESTIHLKVRTFLYQLLCFALGGEHSVGSDQFVYWNPRNPRRCLAPDVFVRLDRAQHDFGSWKTWERGGIPQLAIEIKSEHESIAWEEKLERYHELGVEELVRFDPDAPEGSKLRVWDLINADLVEREVEDDTTPCTTLQLVWVVRPLPEVPCGLRLVDAKGNLVLNALETAQKAREAEQKAREAEQKARETEQKAREAAEARVRELEALLLKGQ